jgi:hypothetical protein
VNDVQGIADDFTQKCVAIEVDRSLPGARVVRVLERLAATIGLPSVIVCDNGPEFIGRTLRRRMPASRATQPRLVRQARVSPRRTQTGGDSA